MTVVVIWHYTNKILLTLILLLSTAYLHLSRHSFTYSLLSLQITILSANIIVHGNSCLSSSVNPSITIANKKGKRADPWHNTTPTLNPSVTPTTPYCCLAVLIHVLQHNHIHQCHLLTSSCTVLLLAPYHTLSLNPQSHGA